MMPRHWTAIGCIASLLVLAWAAAAPAVAPRPVQATVDRVVDGDTVVATSENATKLRIRLLGIDAPEVAHGHKPDQPFGPEARRHLERLVVNQSVRLELYGPDIYRRILAVIWAGDTNVNVQMVRVGLAEIYRGARCRAYCRDLAEAETGARRERSGIWGQALYESPTVYRRRTRS
jgi:endonuclease YncB( thermonuclease family)